jgi:hypothetical protein
METVDTEVHGKLRLNDHLNNAKILHKCLCFCVDLKSMMAANMENGFT